MQCMNTHEILVTARNLIDKYGLLQGAFGSPEEGFCAVGAISHAHRVPSNRPHFDYKAVNFDYKAVNALMSAIKGAESFRSLLTALTGTETMGDFEGGFNFSNISMWSDDSSKEEVLEVFDKAIANTAPEPEDLQLDEIDLDAKVYA